jgi:hypothetical protein
MVALVNGRAGGQYGNFVFVSGTGQLPQDRLWLRCYRPGEPALSFGFTRHAGRLRVAQGLERFGLVMALQEPEFDTVSATLDAVQVVIQATIGLSIAGPPDWR